MNRLMHHALPLSVVFLAWLTPASTEEFKSRGDFTETLSNNTPLAFGMDVDEAARALGTPLSYVSGRADEEIYLTFRNLGGGGLFLHQHRLFLQFRKGRLAGWKGDWGHNWMWQ